LSEARKIAYELQAEVARGRDQIAERRIVCEKLFADVHERYLKEHAQKRNKSWRQADALIKRNVLPQMGRREITTISRADIRKLLARIKAPSVANQTLAAVSAVFTWAVKMDISGTNPCEGIEKPNPTTSRSRILADDEIKAIWPLLSAPLRVILLSGQRPGEVSHMRYEHIKDWWELSGPEVPELEWPGTKNGRDHKVWLSEPVRDIIATIRACSGSEHTPGSSDSHRAGGDSHPSAGFVFERMGRAVSGLDKDMRDICQRLGIERATPHDLRRTFASTVTRLGFTREAMRRVLNHADRSVNAVYDRYQYEVENKRIMESVAQHIVAIAEGREGDNVVRGKFHGAEPA
jgi:integrase